MNLLFSRGFSQNVVTITSFAKKLADVRKIKEYRVSLRAFVGKLRAVITINIAFYKRHQLRPYTGKLLNKI